MMPNFQFYMSTPEHYPQLSYYSNLHCQQCFRIGLLQESVLWRKHNLRPSPNHQCSHNHMKIWVFRFTYLDNQFLYLFLNSWCTFLNIFNYLWINFFFLDNLCSFFNTFNYLWISTYIFMINIVNINFYFKFVIL